MAKGSSATKTNSVQKAKKELRAFLKKLDTVPTKILQEEEQILKAEIIAEVPYKTGKLERSVRVAVAKDRKRPGINASASALSPKGYNYAGIQHENKKFKHPVKGKYHYISEPFRRSTLRIMKRFNDELSHL